MSLARYSVRSSRSGTRINGQDKASGWMYRICRSSSRSVSLEQEIYHLRCELEQAVVFEQSLTAPKVVEVSSRLDVILNEYMSVYQRA